MSLDNKTSEKNIQDVVKNDPTLKASVRDGMAHAAMLGCGETYLNPFAVFLNGTAFQIGLLASLPVLIGSILQTIGVWLTEKFPSRLKIVLAASAFQAIIWLPIALIPFLVEDSAIQVTILIFFAVLCQTGISLTTPAWNSLIGDLVPIEIRGSFFGYRNKFIGIATLLAVITSGQILYLFSSMDMTTYGFFAVFFSAMCFRLLSLLYLKKYRDVPYQNSPGDRFTFWQFLRKTPKSNYARFVFFVACMNFSAYIAAPYFSIYLLEDVKVNYFDYTIIISTTTFTQILAIQYWGRLSDQFGNRKIMEFCGIGVAIVPLFWLFFTYNTFVIILIQAFAGISWAGFNLAAANFMFDAVTPPKRARCVAYQSIVNSTFVCLGALSGSYLTGLLKGSEFLSSGWGTPNSDLLRIFVISGTMRLIVLLGLFRVFKEVRSVEKIRHRDLIFRIVSLRPLSGIGIGVITGLVVKRGKKVD